MLEKKREKIAKEEALIIAIQEKKAAEEKDIFDRYLF